MRGKITVFLALVAVLPLISLLSGCQARQAQKPHIVLLILDTLRADKVGAYGNSQNLSPELDQMAARGVRFNRVIAQSSWTRTSIGSFLTSQYPRTLGIFKEQWDVLPKHFTTIAEVLQAHGYYTLGVTANPNINSTFNFNQGFEAYVDSNVVFPWMKPEEGKQRANKNLRLPKAEDIFARANQEINIGLKAGKPLFVMINIMDVHGWSDLRPEVVEADLQNDPAGKYLQSVRIASQQTGLFVKELESRKEFKNCLFLIVSDHGEGLYDHPDVPDTLRHGNVLYESQVRVPWIMWNQSEPGMRRVVEKQVRLLDLMPTLLDYASVEAPKGMQGVSLMPLVRGVGEVHLPAVAFTETEWKKVHKVGLYSEEGKYFENRDSWPGTLPQELQEIGIIENGAKTDVGTKKPELLKKLQDTLKTVESPILKQDSVQIGEDPSAEEIEQLKSLGYLG
jgi:arylsulfatase A-like enzyme